MGDKVQSKSRTHNHNHPGLGRSSCFSLSSDGHVFWINEDDDGESP